MKKINFLAIPVTAIAFCTPVSTLLAQDPVHVDAKHYKVVAENNDLRVWWLKDGKLVKFQQYADTKQVSDAVKN